MAFQKYFFRNLGAILTYAIIGTSISVLVVGWVFLITKFFYEQLKLKWFTDFVEIYLQHFNVFCSSNASIFERAIYFPWYTVFWCSDFSHRSIDDSCHFSWHEGRCDSLFDYFWRKCTERCCRDCPHWVICFGFNILH